MSVGGALNLRDFDQRFIAHAQFGVFLVDGVPCPVSKREHRTVGAVAVVGNRQAFYALLAQAVHPVPKSLGITTVQSRERHRGQLVCSAKDYIAVKIP